MGVPRVGERIEAPRALGKILINGRDRVEKKA